MKTLRDRTAWLMGGDAMCNVQPPEVERPLRLILLGAPGVGKGTQAELLTSGFACCQLSTGDVFRAASSADHGGCTGWQPSPAMTAALGYMRRGELVPDQTVLNLVTERVNCLRCRGGFLLDGFPRTVAQAEALDKILEREKLKLDAVISYDLPIEEVVARASGRRTCSKCKAVYHLTARPPSKEGICDRCGGALFQREDDKPETIRVRQETYARSTAPLIDYYKKQGLLISISADGVPGAIFARTLDALAPRILPPGESRAGLKS
jgi:adenylate kinase